MKKLLLSFAISVFSITAYPCIHGNGDGFLPKNDMKIPALGFKALSGGVTESEFNSVIDEVERVYAPIVRGYGGNLSIQRLWSDATVNAEAQRQGSTYLVKMYGGLARHHTITKDAFTLVACHEVGHHIGGVPRYTKAGGTWASTEGQSDYFATSKCMRKIFRDDDNESIVKSMTVDPLVKSNCEAQFSVANDIAICKRISMAGQASASLFAAMQGTNYPKFDTPDKSVVTQTYESHPQYQCRLDTYFEGAKCEVQDTVEIGQSSPNVGTCNRPAGHTEGPRPLCWYKPTGGVNPDPDPDPNPTGAAKTPTVNGQTSVTSSNPNQAIPVFTDVSGFNGVKFVAVEFSKVNQPFSNPNSIEPDKVNGMRVEVYPNITGTYNVIPARHLPMGWGSYQMRVIGLDSNKTPVSKNSNALNINMSR